MSEEKLTKFNFVVTPEFLAEIDKYRQDTGRLPSKSEAVRELVMLGLKTYYEAKAHAGSS